MLFNLLAPFADQFQVFNLFRYLTFRTGGAMMTALFLSFLFGPWIINWLKSQQGAGQPIRTDGPETDPVNARTQSMGGFWILFALGLSTLLWADLRNSYVWITVFVTVGLGAVRLADSYLPLPKGSPQGVSRRATLIWDIGIAGLAAWFALLTADPTLAVPVLGGLPVPSEILFVSLAMLVMFGALHAVKPRGGLANVPVLVIACGGFGLIAFLAGIPGFARHFEIAFVPGSGELTVFAGALIGASLGFLRQTAAVRI